jgi:HK97 family phage prohead protease
MNTLCLRAVEFRATEQEENDGRTLEGYAAVFRSPTMISSWDGDFEEEIVRGAFRNTIKAKTPVLQFDHGRDHRTGSVPIGAFEELKEDDHGLYVRARMFDNDLVEPIRQAIEGKAITGMSFRFECLRDEWRDNKGKKIKDDELSEVLFHPGDRGPLKRSVLEVDLHEAGPVVFPAYDATSVGVRSLLEQVSPDERQALVRELAQHLKDFTGRPSTRGAGGGDSDAQPGGEASAHRNKSRHRRLTLEGIIQ